MDVKFGLSLYKNTDVFANRVPRRIVGPNRKKMVAYWRRLHDEELHNLYISSHIIRVINPRMRWAMHAAWSI
jgi:hypothetical protein